MRKLKKKIRRIIRTKTFHCIIIALIILAMVIFALIKIKKYDVEGESEMPFEISKINVISSVGGETIQKPEGEQQNRWDLQISQNNDFYIYVEKNKNYKSRQEEIIKSIEIKNIQIEKAEEKGENKIYRPDEASEKEMFRNVAEDEVQNITYKGAPESNVKKLEMNNQGDLIYFRYTNKDITKYSSNEEELDYSQLLKLAGIREEQLKATVKFDIVINLESNKSFNTTVATDIPIQGVVESGRSSSEIIESNKLIFKRN